MSGIIFGTLFIFIVIALWYWIANSLWDVIDSKSWPSVPGKIIESKVAKQDWSDDVTWEVTIRYTFKVRGYPVWSERLAWGQSKHFASQELAERHAMRFPVGKKVTVWYHPVDYNKCVLTPGLTRAHGPAIVLFFLLTAFFVSFYVFVPNA